MHDFSDGPEIPADEAQRVDTFAINHAAATSPDVNRVWTVFAVFIVAWIAALIAAVTVLLVMVLAQHGWEGLTDPETFETLATSLAGTNLSLVGLELTIVVSVLIAAALSPVPLVRRLRLQPAAATAPGYLIMLAGMLAVSQALDSSLEVLGIERGAALRMLDEMIAQAHGLGLVCTALVVGLGAGFGEELLCRGYIQTRLSRRWGAGIAIAVSSMIFAIMHLDVVHSTLALGMGVYLGFITERAGSIRPAIFCHTLNNVTSVLLASRFSEGWSPGTHQALLVISILVAGLCIAYVFRAVPTRAAGGGTHENSLLSR